MFKLITAILLIISSPAPSEKTSSSEKKEVLLVGDSMAEGLYPNLKKDGIQYRITPMYKRGTAVPFWNRSAELSKAIKEKKWDIVLVSLGTNDLRLKQKTMEEYFQFNEKLSSIKADVYWIIPPVMPFRNELVEEWIENPPPPIQKIDCSTYQFNRAPDKIHLQPSGYKAWSQCVLDSLP